MRRLLLDGIWHDGVRAFAAEYLGRAGRLVPFGGREAELSQIEAFFRGVEPCAILCAEAGRGKSALVLRAAEKLTAAGEAVAWLPLSLRFGTTRSAVAEPLLSARVSTLLGRNGHWADQLGSGGSGTEPRVLVVLDGLDELGDDGLLEALARFAPAPRVRLLVTARRSVGGDAATWARRLGWNRTRELRLGPLDLSSVARLVAAEAPRASAAEVMLRSGGDPLLVRLCVEALRDGLPLPESDPESLVDAWWEAQRRSLEKPAGALAGDALAALGLARGVIPWSDLAAVLGTTQDALRAAQVPFERFLVGVPGEGIAFAHPRFGEVARGRPEARALGLRFAASATEARKRKDPGRYWLEVGAAHLAAAETGAVSGAFDVEAWDGLTSVDSLDSWRRHEGGLTGFLADLGAGRTRVGSALARAWTSGDTAAVEPLLERQARLGTLEAALAGEEVSTEPRLRAALVSHGLRSSRSALASIAEVPPGNRFESVRALLPVLPDALLPALVALDGPSWPRADVVKRLVAAGAVADAVRHLLKSPRFMAEALVEIAPRLEPADVASGREAILAAHAAGPSGDDDGSDVDRDRATLLETRLQLVSLLGKREGAAELDAIAGDLEALPPAALYCDGTYGEVDPRSRVAEGYARQGRGPEALDWLSRIRELPVPWEPDQRLPGGGDGFWPDELIRVHASVASLLGPTGGEPVRAWLAGAPAAGKLSVAAWVLLTAVLPENDFLEAAWEAAERQVRDGLATFFGRSDTHPFLFERAAHALLSRVERAFAPRRSSSAKARAETDSELADLAFALAGRPHPEGARLLAFAARWLERLPSASGEHASAFARLLVVNATDDRLRAMAAPLIESLAGEGVPLLALEGWETVVAVDVRRRLLARRAAAPLVLGRPEEWVTRLCGTARELREALEAEAADLLVGAAIRCAGADVSLLALCAGPADDETQGVLADGILAAVGPRGSGGAWAFVDEVTALSALAGALRDPERKERAAREALARVPAGRWPEREEWWKPVFEALPPEEVDAAYRRLARRGVPEWPIDSSVPLSLRREVFAARRATLEKRRPGTAGTAELWWASFEVPEGEEVRSSLRARLRDEVPRLPDASGEDAPRHAGWQALGWIVPSSDAEELLFFGSFLHRMPLSTAQGLGRRAAELVRTDDPLGEALLDLARCCAGKTRTHHLGYHLAVDVARAEARHRGLDGDGALAWIFEQAGPPEEDSWWSAWLAETFRAEGWEPALARHVVSLPEPADRLRAWSAVWPSLPSAEREALAPALAAAALDERSGKSWVPLSHALPSGIAEALLLRETGRATREYWFPAAALRVVGGAGATRAWARGVVAALEPFGEPGPGAGG